MDTNDSDVIDCVTDKDLIYNDGRLWLNADFILGEIAQIDKSVWIGTPSNE